MVSETVLSSDDYAHALASELELDLCELQRMYVEAKGKLEIESLVKLRKQLELTSNQMEPHLHEEQERAREIARTIPEIARREAAAGRRFAGIMKLAAEDFTKIPEYMDTLDPEYLVPSRAGWFLYRLCVEKGLNPQIKPFHEIDGFRSGFELTVNW